MADESDEQLLLRAEIFRSKLIEHFHLLDNFSDNSAEEVPKYYSDELKHDKSMKEMLRISPNALVKFEVYTKTEEMTYADKRLNRIKTKNTIPLGPWAKMVVENSRVQSFMLMLIISNSIVLGIQAEISQTDENSYHGLKVFLNIFDYLSLMFFILEILLKWIDGFIDFWKNGWNVFDFFVTIMSFVPEIIRLSSGDNANNTVKIVADNLRTFRILRSLKMVSRFAQLRIIVLTILKALKSMAFILMLLATFMYIFAVTGTVMFAAHAKSTRTDIDYRSSFSTLVNSLLTLFQLFTLDHWFEILTDLGKAANDLFSKMYIVLWICVGSFIFKNVFTGIMVMNFQNIRNDFVMQCKEHEQAIKEEQRKTKLEEELAKQYRSHSISARRKSSAAAALFNQSGSFSHGLPGIPEDSDTGEVETIEEEDEDSTFVAPGFDNVESIGPSKEMSESEKSPSAGPDAAKDSGEKNAQDMIKEREEGDSAFDRVRRSDQEENDQPDDPEKKDSKQIEPSRNQNINESNRMFQENIMLKDAWKETQPVDNGLGNEDETKIPNVERDEMMTNEAGNFKDYPASSAWNRMVTENLTNLKSNASETLWPRDSLFDYFQLMEALQDNLAERHQLQKLAALALNQIHDGRL